MAVKIRLARRGRKKHPYYHIVVADARSPRDGKFIERIGSYNPQTVPATIELDREKAYNWIQNGAQPTDTVNAILKFKGVLYKKHLSRGVAKGAFSQETADQMLEEWINTKEARIEARKDKTKAAKNEFHKMVSGEAKPKVVVAAAVEDQEAFRETEAEVEQVIETAPEVTAETVDQAPVSEETATEEAATEETAE